MLFVMQIHQHVYEKMLNGNSNENSHVCLNGKKIEWSILWVYLFTILEQKKLMSNVEHHTIKVWKQI